jgi:predicted transcriptional regulator
MITYITYGATKIPITFPAGWLRILEALAVQPRTVTELQLELNIEHQNTLSSRLLKMTEAGLVCYVKGTPGVNRGGTNLHYYQLQPDGIKALSQDIHSLATELEQYIDKKTSKKKKGQIP